VHESLLAVVKFGLYYLFSICIGENIQLVVLMPHYALYMRPLGVIDV